MITIKIISIISIILFIVFIFNYEPDYLKKIESEREFIKIQNEINWYNNS